MVDLYPFRILPDFKERVWGSRELSPMYSEVPADKPIGEVWLTGDENRVADGPLAGATLRELCRRFGRDLLGDTVSQTDRFPLLIKFLFPRAKLSVQVHPDDAAARSTGEPCGKTECWYVVQADEGAQIGLGLKPGTTREQLARAIQQSKAEELLNWIPLSPGEMYYVDAGTVHAIGPGSILVETQQNSDTTYRLYDYGRPRELHVEQAMQVLKEKTRSGKVKPSAGNGIQDVLITCSHFNVTRWRLADASQSASSSNDRSWRSVEVLVGLAGGGLVEAAGFSPVTFSRGEAVVIPASVDRFRIRPQWQLEALSIYLPPAAHASEPDTILEIH